MKLPNQPIGKDALFHGYSSLEPLDWQTGLTGKLVVLAELTPNNFAKVHELFEQAFQRLVIVNCFDKPVLCETMVNLAIEIHTDSLDNQHPITTSGAQYDSAFEQDLPRRAASASPTPGPSNSQPTPPQSPRSETMVPDIVEAAPVMPAAPMVPNMLVPELAAASLPSPEIRSEERSPLMEQCMVQLEDLDDSDEWHKKRLEENEITRRRLNRKMRNVGKGYAVSGSQMPI